MKTLSILIASIFLLLLLFMGLNNSPNFLYPVTFKKDIYHKLFNEKYISNVENIYAFRNRKNDFFIYDIDRTNRIIIWKFNEIDQLPFLDDSITPRKSNQYTYLTIDFPEINIHKKQGRYQRGIHRIGLSQSSQIESYSTSEQQIGTQLILDKLYILNNLDESEIIIEMKEPTYAYFSCVIASGDFFIILSYGLDGRRFSEDILNSDLVKSLTVK